MFSFFRRDKRLNAYFSMMRGKTFPKDASVIIFGTLEISIYLFLAAYMHKLTELETSIVN